MRNQYNFIRLLPPVLIGLGIWRLLEFSRCVFCSSINLQASCLDGISSRYFSFSSKDALNGPPGQVHIEILIESIRKPFWASFSMVNSTTDTGSPGCLADIAETAYIGYTGSSFVAFISWRYDARPVWKSSSTPPCLIYKSSYPLASIFSVMSSTVLNNFSICLSMKY